jgi:hypothetical protein
MRASGLTRANSALMLFPRRRPMVIPCDLTCTLPIPGPVNPELPENPFTRRQFCAIGRERLDCSEFSTHRTSIGLLRRPVQGVSTLRRRVRHGLANKVNPSSSNGHTTRISWGLHPSRSPISLKFHAQTVLDAARTMYSKLEGMGNVTCWVWTSRATKSSRVPEGTWGPWRHSTGLETRRYLLR